MEDESLRRVVITGIGIVSPLANGREETWRRLLDGESGAAPIRAFDAQSWPTTIACEVKDFDLHPEACLPHHQAYLTRASSFGMQAAFEAMLDSQLPTHDSDVGIAVGANVSGIPPWKVTALRAGQPTDDGPHEVIKNHPGTLASLLSQRWRCFGPIVTCQTACASSGQALGAAFRMIQRDECDAVLTGGADSLASELLLAGFCLIGALSKRNADPAAASRPFDAQRDGFVAGEGAAFLILESLSSAEKRGAHIYAEVCGYGESESAFRITDLPPDGRGVVEAMNDAMNEAQILPENVGYINAHGTSTELNDRIEALSIERVFYDHGGRPWISSTKSCTGHLISAAGAIELAFCALAIRDGQLPPNRNLERTDCSDRLRMVMPSSISCRLDYALSNSVGFGGSNSSLLVGRFGGFDGE